MPPHVWLAIAVGLSALVQLEAQPSAPADPIRKLRMGKLIVATAPDTAVRVEQIRHEFSFGVALANQVFNGRLNAEDAAKYKQVFLENFNSAVTENALKWHDMEPQPGQVDYAVVDAMLAWTAEHQLPLRGHNIYWGIPNRVQPWLKEMDDDTLRATLKARALDVGRRYRGRFAEYDLNNEMLHANYYEERLGPDITRQMAEWVHEADPDAVLYLNDYDILTGRRLDDYLAHIRRFLDQGVAFAGIGVQGHLHGDSFDPAAEAYRDLLFKEWWTRWEGRTDAQGRCEVPAFFGKHRVTAGDQSVEVRLNKAEGTTRCTL